jgi:hypothetical protein
MIFYWKVPLTTFYACLGDLSRIHFQSYSFQNLTFRLPRVVFCPSKINQFFKWMKNYELNQKNFLPIDALLFYFFFFGAKNFFFLNFFVLVVPTISLMWHMSSSEGISSQNSKNAFVVKFFAAVIGKLILRVKWRWGWNVFHESMNFNTKKQLVCLAEKRKRRQHYLKKYFSLATLSFKTLKTVLSFTSLFFIVL